MNFIVRFLWLILTIAAISLAMVFAVSNTQQVTLRFWPFTGQLEIAAWVLVIGAMATGAVFTWFTLGHPWYWISVAVLVICGSWIATRNE